MLLEPSIDFAKKLQPSSETPVTDGRFFDGAGRVVPR